MTKGFSRATRAITWVAAAATALSFVMPAMAFQSFPGSAVYEWGGQNGTDNGSAHVINANAGDTVQLSLTMINRSQDPQAKVWYGASSIIPEGPSYPDAHKIGIGTAHPNDGIVSWLDSSSFVSHGNRFAYYDGAPVNPGQSITMTWNVKISATAGNGTYDLYVNPVREFDSWFKQTKNGKILSDSDIFWRFNIGGAVTPGVLNVAANNMPAAQSVAFGSTNVTAAGWRITNSASNATTLSSLTVKRTGIGAANEILNGYLYNGATRLASGRTFNSSTNEATFSGLNLNIPANGFVDLTLVIDFVCKDGVGTCASGVTSNGQHMFSIENATKIGAGSSTVGGAFPITSNTITVINSSVGTVTLDAVGSTTAEANVGTTGVMLANFKVSTDSVEDAYVKRVSLWQGGSAANSTVTNLTLKQGGITYATATGVDSKGYANFVLTSPFKIERGNNRTFEVWGDLTGGRAGDTVAFYIDSSVDFFAQGGTNGSGMGVTFSDFDSSAGDHLTVTLKGGILTLSFVGPSTADITSTANDAVIWKANVTASSNLEVRNWYFTLADTTAGDPDLRTGGISYVQDVKLWNLTNNTVIGGPQEITTNVDSKAFTFTEDYTFLANTTTMIGVSVDIKNSPADATISLQGTLTAFTDSDIRNIDSNTYLTVATDVAPSGSIAGYIQTVRSAGVTVALAPSPVTSTAVKGAGLTGTPYNPVAFNFTAGSGGSVKVTALTVTGQIDGAATDGTFAVNTDAGEDINDYVQEVSLWDGTTQIGTAKSLEAGGTVTFSNLNWMIPASTTKKLSIGVRLSTSGPVYPVALAFAIGQGDVTVLDQDGSTIDTSAIPASDAAGNLAASPTVYTTVSTVGSLTVAQAADTPLAKIVIAGATAQTLARFRFTAVDEPFLVKKFTLTSQAAADNGRITTMNLRYPVVGGGTATAVVSLSGTANTVDISGNPMYVGQNQDAYVDVLADLASMTQFNDTQSAIDLIYGIDANNSSVGNQATGFWSGADDDSWGSDVTGNAQWVFRTKLTVQGGANTTNLSGNAEQDLYKFTMQSDTANQAAVKAITFNAAITDAGGAGTLTVGGLKMFKGSTDITSSGTFYAYGSVSDAVLDETETRIVFVWTSYENVSSTSQDYTLKGTPAGFNASDNDYLTIGIAGDSDYDTGDGTVNSVIDATLDAGTKRATLADRATTDTDETAFNFVWSDNSTIPLTVTDNSTGWFGGYLLDFLPTSTIQKTI